jgi:RNA polymerase sigma factor (TIGR02999 family)
MLCKSRYDRVLFSFRFTLLRRRGPTEAAIAARAVRAHFWRLTWRLPLDTLIRFLRNAMGFDASESGAAPGEVTTLLRRLVAGEECTRNELISLMYPELKRLAEAHMRRERADHTLQPTALVNEFFLEIARTRVMHWRDRKHFLAVAAQAMRRFLIDYARAHNAKRRGGGAIKLQLTDLELPLNGLFDPSVVGELLDRLAREEPRMERVVEMHSFGGLTFGEIAEILEIDERTARRDWQVARAWLYGQLSK